MKTFGKPFWKPPLVAAAVLFLFFAAFPLSAAESPLKLVSWASPMGDQSVQFETLYGLKAMLNFINSKGGVRGKRLELFTLEMDEDSDNFHTKLDTLVLRVKPHLVVGGVANVSAKETSDYFRRVGRLWFGPWTDNQEIYQGLGTDPIGLFPAAPTEFALLLEYASRKVPGDKPIYLVMSENPTTGATAELAKSTASGFGMELRVVTIPQNFRDWEALKGHLTDAGGILLWTSPGPSSAIRRVLKKTMSGDILWMTNSLNQPSHEIMAMADGTWNGTVFPAVLTPSDKISEAHKVVLEKYALPGLKMDYPAFLGFAQGQVLVKAVAKLGDVGNATPELIAGALRDLDLTGSIISGQKLPHGAFDRAGTYLAISDGRGDWYPAE
ncbi:MAG: ABC transporter substrate-binding protein [Deltaproteobacteria bacterium]|jgi:ABC-type branched-subunit amino acid transport system substrate-binding protein|nr:ABC transporter substrate-binding protein [Deltaproteobacteria bacterium]